MSVILTRRLQQVLDVFKSSATSSKGIGLVLGMSPRTVDHYLCIILKKYNVHSRGQLMAKLMKPDTAEEKPAPLLNTTDKLSERKRDARGKGHKHSRVLAERWIKACEEKNNCDLCREGKACRALYDTLI